MDVSDISPKKGAKNRAKTPTAAVKVEKKTSWTRKIIVVSFLLGKSPASVY